MSRITTVTDDLANHEQAELFTAIKSNLGIVPNFLRVFANSPDALKAFLGFHHIAGNGSLDAETRERIALTLAQKNECEYCLSAHTAIGRKTGLNTDEINSQGTPDTERNRNRHFFQNEINDFLVTEKTFSEIECCVITHHLEITNMQRFIKTVHSLNFIDQFRSKTLRSSIF